MKSEAQQDDWVDLADAIEALRRDLTDASRAGQNSGVRFRIEPVELTVQVGVTRTGSGSAGVRWHIFTLDGKKSRETSITQTMKLRLVPVLQDEHGSPRPDDEQFIAGRDVDVCNDSDRITHQPE